ncbi:hypothetical protein [Brassicibacter mesophilus]|uniref:hypothetical protein n=1 Tax=Brassicibacter mesophilus TaxID=745119 RepID=UPI003D251A23
MIALLCGDKGSGKTKRLIEMANNDTKSCKGDIVFIDADNSQVLNLKHKVRLVNAMEFNINNIEKFHGFLCGIIGNNYDVEKIYVDGLYKIIKPIEMAEEGFVKLIESLSNKYNTSFVISVSCNDDNVPEHLQKYVIK